MSIPQELGMAFWIIPLCLQPLIALAIIVRRLIKEFPHFFLYTLFVSGRDLALLFLRHNTQLYSWIYFVAEPVAIILGLAVVYEVFWQLMRPYEMLRTLGVRLFWVSLGVAVAAGLTMLKMSQFGLPAFWIESIVLAERSARFVQVGVLIVFILFISRLGLTWKHYTSGIVAGFGIAAGLQLALFELRSLHAIADTNFVLLMSAAYNCAVMVWAIYFVFSRMQTSVPKELPATDLVRWDELLRKYLNR
jgi:hypothetical protein